MYNIESNNSNKLNRQIIILGVIFVTSITAGALFLVKNLYKSEENSVKSIENDMASPSNLDNNSTTESVLDNVNTAPATQDSTKPSEVIINEGNFDQETDVLLQDLDSLETDLGNDQDLSNESLGL